jgi:hypothetical protein
MDAMATNQHAPPTDTVPAGPIERLADHPAALRAYDALVQFRGSPMTVSQIADTAGISTEAWYTRVGDLLQELGLVEQAQQMGNAQTYRATPGEAYDAFTSFRAALQYAEGDDPRE